jgi:hypothetical protein
MGDLNEAVNVIKKLQDSEFISFADGDEAIVNYAKKQLEFGHMIVEYLDGEPVGYICFYANDHATRVVFISAIVVTGSGLQRGKVFYNLITEGARIGIREGMTSVKLEVDKDNISARKLYEQIGFEYTGEEKEHSVYMVIEKDVFLEKTKIKIEE